MVTPFETYLEKRLSPFLKYSRKKEVLEKVDKELTPIIKSFVRASLPKIQPSIEEKQVVKLIKEAISKIPEVKPAKEVIREIKTIEIKEKSFDELRKEIEILKRELEAFKQILPLGGSGVIGLPNLEGNNGKTLQVINNQPKWQSVASAGTSFDVYTPTNVTTDRSFDATLTSLDEIANVLGSLIISLQGAGIIQ